MNLHSTVHIVGVHLYMGDRKQWLVSVSQRKEFKLVPVYNVRPLEENHM